MHEPAVEARTPVRAWVVVFAGMTVNLCLGILGGLPPFTATLIVEKSGNHLAPAFLIMGAAAIAFIAVLTFKETYRLPLPGSVVDPRRRKHERSPRQPAPARRPAYAMISGRS